MISYQKFDMPLWVGRMRYCHVLFGSTGESARTHRQLGASQDGVRQRVWGLCSGEEWAWGLHCLPGRAAGQPLASARCASSSKVS
jgi:hypothetical protein